MNGRIKDLNKESVWNNQFVKHALSLGWGSKEITFEWKNVPEELKKDLEKWIK